MTEKYEMRKSYLKKYRQHVDEEKNEISAEMRQ